MIKVIVEQHGNWFTFSPSGYKDYTRNDESVLHGFKNLIVAIKQAKCTVSNVRGYNLKGTMHTAEEINKNIERG